jgi:NADH dehydrogenase FAD-containing subunit
MAVLIRGTVPDCRWLTFVIVGGGATGAELAGATGEITRQTLRNDFRSFIPRRLRSFSWMGLPGS